MWKSNINLQFWRGECIPAYWKISALASLYRRGLPGVSGYIKLASLWTQINRETQNTQSSGQMHMERNHTNWRCCCLKYNDIPEKIMRVLKDFFGHLPLRFYIYSCLSLSTVSNLWGSSLRHTNMCKKPADSLINGKSGLSGKYIRLRSTNIGYSLACFGYCCFMMFQWPLQKGWKQKLVHTWGDDWGYHEVSVV